MKRLILALAAALGCLAATAQGFGVVNISVCNLRRTDAFNAEMVSQALLGTPVHILETGKQNPWPHVQTPDGYSGWVHYAAITQLSPQAYHAWNDAPKAIVTALSGVIYRKPTQRSATVSDVVAGDRLRLLEKRAGWLKVAFPDGRMGYISRKAALPEEQWRRQLSQTPEAILASARSMLGFPYLWAGMSPKGMDCSGFVRTVLWMHDIILPRDAGPQSRAGQRIPRKEDLRAGDLVFFGSLRPDGTPSVSHVGIVLEDGRHFIHSMGLVQIGSLSPEDQDYDAFNAGRFLFGASVLPFVNRDPKITTSKTNPFYAE